MMLRRGVFAAVAAAVVSLAVVLLSGCNVDPVPGRFTYIVKYEVTADAAVTIDIDYTNEASAPVSNPGQLIDPATPWSYEFPAAFNYDDPLFYPTLDAAAAVALNVDETVKVKIIWKDYRVDFREQALEVGYLNNDGTTVVDTISLVGPELPRY
jgi:hypothetical protein